MRYNYSKVDREQKLALSQSLYNKRKTRQNYTNRFIQNRDYYHNNNNNDVLNREFISNLRRYYDSLIEHSDKINIFRISQRICPDRSVCAISLEEIYPGSQYMKCRYCNNCFYNDIIRQWLRYKFSCPLCRYNWIDYNTYINQ